MRAVGLKTLKNKLSEYIRLVESGETILVTDRDHVVAEIRPPGIERSPSASDALLADAIRQGLITPRLLTASEPPMRDPVSTFEEILRELDEDRDSR